MAESGNCGFVELFKLPAYITPLLSSGEGIRSPGNGAAEVSVSWVAQGSVCKADFNELIRSGGAGMAPGSLHQPGTSSSPQQGHSHSLAVNEKE